MCTSQSRRMWIMKRTYLHPKHCSFWFTSWTYCTNKNCSHRCSRLKNLSMWKWWSKKLFQLHTSLCLTSLKSKTSLSRSLSQSKTRQSTINWRINLKRLWSWPQLSIFWPNFSRFVLKASWYSPRQINSTKSSSWRSSIKLRRKSRIRFASSAIIWPPK